MSGDSEGPLPTKYHPRQSADVIEFWGEQDHQLQQFGALGDALVFVMEQVEPERHASVLIALDRSATRLGISEIEVLYLEMKIAEAKASSSIPCP